MADKGMIGKIIENYRIELVLGQGGMAAVYKATDIKLQRPVAIKIMHPHLASQTSFQQRFLQEARAAASLDHDNIVKVLSFNNIEGELFLVMELITGGNLRQYIKRLNEGAQFIDYPEAIEVTRQLAEALDYAHRRDMIHRDRALELNIGRLVNGGHAPLAEHLVNPIMLDDFANHACHANSSSVRVWFPYCTERLRNGFARVFRLVSRRGRSNERE